MNREATARYYSDDYAQARERFRAAAKTAGAALDALPVLGEGPRSEALSIDLAWLGPRDARRVLIHSSGLHGIEGYAGSAVQLALLAHPPPLPPDCALLLAHALNPWGMAWGRRTNAANVDLNRNALPAGEAWAGSSPGYARLDPLINPPSPPCADGFYPRALLHVLRHGLGTSAQALAGGQYDYPEGLFFGGTGLQPELAAYRDWLRDRLCPVRDALVLDVHTGLGPRGRDTLIVERADHTALLAGLRETPEVRLRAPRGDDALGYRVRGGLVNLMTQALPGARITHLIQEFGTLPLLRMLHALREENRAHLHGGSAEGRGAVAKERLHQAACPISPA